MIDIFKTKGSHAVTYDSHPCDYSLVGPWRGGGYTHYEMYLGVAKGSLRVSADADSLGSILIIYKQLCSILRTKKLPVSTAVTDNG